MLWEGQEQGPGSLLVTISRFAARAEIERQALSPWGCWEEGSCTPPSLASGWGQLSTPKSCSSISHPPLIIRACSSPPQPACQLDSLLSFQAANLFHILANCIQVERIWGKKPHVRMRVCVCAQAHTPGCPPSGPGSCPRNAALTGRDGGPSACVLTGSG